MATTQAPATRRLGRQTLAFEEPPVILAVAAVGGPMEGKGPLGSLLDEVEPDGLVGQKSWEMAEAYMLQRAVDLALTKASLQTSDIDFLVTGDLLNQLGASTFAGRMLDIPFFGIYGACSSWSEGLVLASALLDGGYAERVVVAVSSHHDAAERQFRYPTEFGVQRPPTSTWTVTGAGAAILARSGTGPRITHATAGRIVDIGEKDPMDLGSAMAPAAADTIAIHLKETGRQPGTYNAIITGDLGNVGKPILEELLVQQGYDCKQQLDDCGLHVYDQKKQDVHGGGSGCACSAVTFCGKIYPDLVQGKQGRVLLVSTGAMFSPTSYQQGESIPGIAYAVAIEGPAAMGGG